LQARFGDAFLKLQQSTSVMPFAAVFDGRQSLSWSEFLRPSQLGIAIAIGVFLVGSSLHINRRDSFPSLASWGAFELSCLHSENSASLGCLRLPILPG
jgi:hypothetical protein